MNDVINIKAAAITLFRVIATLYPAVVAGLLCCELRTCVYRKLDPNILMMESAENGT